MTRDHRIYLQDILDSISRIENYVAEMTYEDFAGDQKTVDAVVRNIEIIGEATKNIPEEIRSMHPDLPWREMAGMRDKMIHGYFEIVHGILWETIKHDLSLIKPGIKGILDK
ncbi:MAG: DUF86 domain-containing protein [Methanomassiliicoccales archaeon]|nr:MAG: DUF86 domain-containing protein [Methanomassiliicoccales archaeon]